MNPFEFVDIYLKEQEDQITESIKSGLEWDDYKFALGQLKQLRLIQDYMKDLEKKFISS